MDRRSFVALILGAVPSGAALGRGPRSLRARSRSQEFLLGQQSEDGAWRSKVYGAFRDGEALTPMVARATFRRGSVASERAIGWLLANEGRALGVFPVHNASWLLELARLDGRLKPRTALLEAGIRKLQLGTSLGWKKEAPSFGGWSYVGAAPRYRKDLQLAPMQQSNLSPTIFAVNALRQAGVGPEDRAMKEAGEFIRSCQNYSDEEGRAASRFDDGGFFQMSEDRWRNKAGVAGTDQAGRMRLRSYFSATVDGLRGLLMTGAKWDDPRVRAALAWLTANPGLADVPDLTLYSAFSRARLQELAIETDHLKEIGAASGLRPDVGILQRWDGSFLNPSGEMRENDPLVATSFAAMSNL